MQATAGVCRNRAPPPPPAATCCTMVAGTRRPHATQCWSRMLHTNWWLALVAGHAEPHHAPYLPHGRTDVARPRCAAVRGASACQCARGWGWGRPCAHMRAARHTRGWVPDRGTTRLSCAHNHRSGAHAWLRGSSARPVGTHVIAAARRATPAKRPAHKVRATQLSPHYPAPSYSPQGVRGRALRTPTL